MAKITKIVKLQSAKFKTHENGSNETSIFLSHSDCELLELTSAGKIKFSIYKEDFILGLGMLMALSKLPLYTKDVVELSINDYKKYLESIDTYFGDSLIADYEINFIINTSQSDRNYFNELNQNGLNIRHFLIENHSRLFFEKVDDNYTLRFKTELEEIKDDEENQTLIENDVTEEDFSIDQLKAIYDEMEKKETGIDGNTTAIPILFGIKYGKSIRKNNFPATAITKWNVELNHGLKVYDNIVANTFNVKFYEQNDKQKDLIRDSHIIPQPSSYTTPEQIIYYGVPGSGKSHTIKEKLKNDYNITESNEDVQVIRTVFHPEYTNADFIGQILPKVVDGKTEFEFVPGPFTKILKKAMWDSANKYVLIIEEINRGNAAAIFGELFQLMDRIDDDDKQTSHEGELNHYGKGWSDYFVMNSEINNYIRDSKDDFDGKALDMNGIHFSANTGIRLPPNLSILATMNTSDQNVFTLDNAFQRRLEKKLIRNEFGNTPKENVQRGALIETTNCKWEDFQKKINELIGQAALEAGLSSMEDKRIGCWFVKNKNGKITKEQFAGNVLKYLWDDAFKFNRDSVFNSEFKNFEELSKAFLNDNKGLGVFTIPFN